MSNFVEEASTMSKIQHPNIVKFIGACTTPPNFCFVAAYSHKGNLFELIKRNADIIDQSTVINIALGIATGIKYLYDLNPTVLHRDLKSANIMLDENLNAQIWPYGFTIISSRVNESLNYVGTVQWVAPEIIEGSQFNEKAEVYSFAIILWELITKSAPYPGVQPKDLAAQIIDGLRPEIPENCDPVIRELLVKCWDKDPFERPALYQVIAKLESLRSL